LALLKQVLEKQLSEFLRRKRGDLTYVMFAKKIGLRSSTLHRLELCQQSITLRSLQQIMRRLRCKLTDIFPNS
jgi:DNA-binding Xre family transcriptional regulator